MIKTSKRKQLASRVWVGLDWGSSEHSVSVVNEDRVLLGQFESGVGLMELGMLAERLRCHGEVAGIAIESTVNPVVRYLCNQGFPIYLINPKLSKNWRAGFSVAGAKSDARDGLVLAVELARRYESLTPLKPGNVDLELAGLCETVRDLVEQRSALVQRLEAVLGQYYPGVLSFFTDWTSPAAWRFINRFPEPETLAKTQKSTLIKFLAANQIGLKPVWLERIEARAEVAKWPRPANSPSLQLMALATTAQLLALQPKIDQCDKLIEEQARKSPQYQLLKSLPGAGNRLAPALTAMTTIMLDNDNMLHALRCMSGVAPVEDTSGKRRKVLIRRRCNKYWRNVLHLFAFCSTNSCEWARAFYKLHRERGDTHGGALRKLADKWLKIIRAMLRNNEVYDDARYVRELQEKHSPIGQILCG